MGTRNLTCVYHDGKYKVAQYGQWDGYPDGQGMTALEFCRQHLLTPEARAKFIARLNACTYPKEAALKKLWEKNGGAAGNPTLTRDTGAEILAMIADSETPLPLHLQIEFAADSLFCEWAWVIDLDAGTFEGFTGFNQNPVGEDERFAYLPRDKKPDGSDSEYYPIKLAKRWPLDSLPTKEEFLAAFEEEESMSGADLGNQMAGLIESVQK